MITDTSGTQLIICYSPFIKIFSTDNSLLVKIFNSFACAKMYSLGNLGIVKLSKEVYFFKRFDYCKIYKTLSLDTSNPLMFYLDNRRIIVKEEIRQPTYYEVKVIAR